MKSSKAKTIIGVIAVVLVVLLLVGGLAALSGGFKDWNAKTWLTARYVCDMGDFRIQTNPENNVTFVESYATQTNTDSYIRFPQKNAQDIAITEIASGAVQGSANIVGIVIPEGYKKIEGGAFQYLGALEKLVIPASVETIDGALFTDVPNVVVYCAAKEKPEGWADNWANNRETPVKVVWGYRA